MIRSATSRGTRRFFGNNSEKKVHDLRNEDTGPNGCKIDEALGAGVGVHFVPDTLKQAHIEGYFNCGKCLGGTRF